MKLSEAKLNELENKVNSLKEKKIRSEEQLKSLRKQKDEVITELAEFGVAPKDLDAAINTLTEQIQTKLSNIDAQIPEDVTPDA